MIMNACPAGIAYLACSIISVINNVLVPLIFAIAFIVFLYGVFKKYIWSNGDETQVQEGHRLILWGLIGFAVMISVWGLVNIVANTFGLGGQILPTNELPQTPTAGAYAPATGGTAP